MPTGAEIMARAATLLNDEDHVRWPLPEMADGINEAVRAIVLAKPSASSESIIVELAEGTLQEVPQAGTPTPLMLQRITRNLKTTANNPRVGDRIITPVARDVLDAQEPNWHDKTRTPHKKLVRHYIYDEANPLEFYVYPGNDGSGIVEAIVSTLPAKLTAVSGQDPLTLAAWTGSIGLPEPYSVPVLDYLLYRCQAKDDTSGNGGRSQAHYQLFAQAIGIKINVEGATSPNARK
jgi:hypothetical protein